MHTVCLLARQQPHRNIPVGASQTPPPIVCPDGATPVKNQREEKRAKTQSVVLEVFKLKKEVRRRKRLAVKGGTSREREGR